jgi:hypothetical protein
MGIYTRDLVKLNWKVTFALLPLIALLSGGCGGINASQSVSPATFLIPGLLKATPPPPANEPLPPVPAGSLVAQAQ